MDIKHGIYRHFKTKNLYKVHGVCKHSETLEDMVLYEPLYEGSPAALWVRPLAMFVEVVEWHGATVPRFEYVGDDAPR